MTPGAVGAERVTKSIWLYLLLAFGISWLCFVTRQATAWPPATDEALRLLVKFGPSLAGILVVFGLARFSGVRDLVGRLIPAWRDARWVVLALLLPLGILALAAIIRELSSVETVLISELTPTSAVRAYAGLLATRFFLGGGLGEELGWRGFLQPQLQTRLSPFETSLVIGVLHGVWHLPAYGLGIVLLTGFTFSMAVISTWMFAVTQGRLFSIVMLHASGNATLAFIEQLFPSLDNDIGFLMIVLLLWLMAAGLVVWRVEIFHTRGHFQ